MTLKAHLFIITPRCSHGFYMLLYVLYACVPSPSCFNSVSLCRQVDWLVKTRLKGDLHFNGHTQSILYTGATVPYDSGQVYPVFGGVWSMREEGISHSPASTRKTLGTRLACAENSIKNISKESLLVIAFKSGHEN